MAMKAIFSAAASGLIAFLSSLLTALQGEHSGFGSITDGQWVTAALAFVVAVAGTGTVTYQVKNRGGGNQTGGDPATKEQVAAG
ncbi:hypothetical protein JIG36_13730 [Actinoplanes sp. LDG1-06]|uniref:Holin n=1 Tax=Paractinoplanes ovalisporus TaxID=2810368 RepID=A0ABS2A9W8_9ACTN|nr:hypothetical protein [Actinoplanes ovalisporus]MBM2616620.1 hypothetical protein [Actinoplanes ovalisporus]